MKYFRTFERYQSNFNYPESKSANSFVGNFFYQSFRKLKFLYRKNKIDKILNSMDEYLNAVYLEYLADREETNIEKISKNNPSNSIEKKGDDIKVDFDKYDDVEDEEKISFGKEIFEPTEKSTSVQSNKFIQHYDKDYTSIISNIFLETFNDALEEIKNKNSKKISYYTKVLGELETAILNKIDEIEEGLPMDATEEDFESFGEKIDAYENFLGDIRELQSEYQKAKKPTYRFNPKRDSITERVNVPVYFEGWTNYDRKIITSKLNPYQMKGYSMEVKYMMEMGVRRRDAFRLEKQWELGKNELFKKWYYIFDVKQIENNSIQYMSDVDSKEGENVIVDNILEQRFDVTNYKSPYYRGLENKNSDFFILTLGINNIYLLRKVFFERNHYTFKLIGEIKYNKNEFSIERDAYNAKSMKIGNKKLVFNKPNNDFPLITVFNNNIYTVYEEDSKVNKTSIKMDFITVSSMNEKRDAIRILDNTERNYTENSFTSEIDEEMKKNILENG